MKVIKPVLVSSYILVISACGGASSGTGGDSGVSVVITPTPSPTPSSVNLIPVSTTNLNADGVGGVDSLELIYEAFGEGSAETPGRYEDDHFGVDHIYEDSDTIVGDHFVFTIHLHEDGDRGEYIDRQRNEIKVYDRSEESLKGYFDTSFQYSWMFKITEGMEFSRYATHLFQLKMKDGVDSSPIVTITVSEVDGIDQVQLRYTPDELDSEVLAMTPVSEVGGEWLTVVCSATYADTGRLEFTITRSSDAQVLISVSEELNMWRAIEDGQVGYVRPKWGIYRRIDDRDNLRTDEEIVRFSDFEVSKMEAVQP